MNGRAGGGGQCAAGGFRSEGAHRALDQPHVRPMDFTGRPLKGMIFVDPEGLRGDALHQWVDAAAGYVGDLPPKPAAPARKRR